MTIQSDNARLPLGSFTFVLHSHLPYVLSHGTWPHGTDWLHEAAAETYIPLLNAFHKLKEEGVVPRVSIGLTPVLCEMLADTSWAGEFEEYLAKKTASAADNAREFAAQNQSEFHDIACFWEAWYRGIATNFAALNRDILGAFKTLQDEGALEIITSAATHGYLPLLGTDESVQAQIAHGVANYRKHFGRAPRGIWLPECAYRPRYEWHAPEEIGGGAPVLRKGIEEFLAEQGIKYFVVDAHLLKGGKEIGTYGERYEALREMHIRTPEVAVPEEERTPLQPYLVVGKTSQPVAFFTRHEKTALQVWSGEHGYPGDGHYLDFHKKHFPAGIGFGASRIPRPTSPKNCRISRGK